MKNILVPKWVADIQQRPLKITDCSPQDLLLLRQKLLKLSSTSPLVSVVIPAWNEENTILHTLISLAHTNTSYEVELIVIDNNSTDGTSALLKQLGITTFLETKQGIGHARNCGLLKAKGTYLLSADSDTLYPEGWISTLTKALIDGDAKKLHCVHGTYSFLPGKNTPRWQYALYELMSGIVIKKQEKTHPFLNVLGFNCGILRLNGIAVDGYALQEQRTFRGEAGILSNAATEDGMMALRLKEAGGAIQAVNNHNARVWTSDRRIEIDGGIKRAFWLRIQKHLFKKRQQQQ